MSSTAWGYGLMTAVVAGPAEGAILDTWYPEPALGRPPTASVPPPGLTALTGTRESAKDRGVKLAVVLTEIDLTRPPADVPDAYLRLHLLSHRLVRPHGLNLDGIFGVLDNVVWTSADLQRRQLRATRLALRRHGPVQVFGVDKFPRMVDYVCRAGVRIGDADRVRLGAHLASAPRSCTKASSTTTPEHRRLHG